MFSPATTFRLLQYVILLILEPSWWILFHYYQKSFLWILKIQELKGQNSNICQLYIVVNVQGTFGSLSAHLQCWSYLAASSCISAPIARFLYKAVASLAASWKLFVWRDLNHGILFLSLTLWLNFRFWSWEPTLSLLPWLEPSYRSFLSTIINHFWILKIKELKGQNSNVSPYLGQL